ncbi:DUF952 domain-containing protein [Ferruginibacter sp. HRS2-29]|uniref:DUF952 domain-containing protein n=1 Tax=Ferruginibacter sp. HRS2-29 TaxID=2487334 RepID=UPI0020CE5087|nr:DUF952 domain-containing protein [Ferruginibacter sp. HRS2-29]MCP9750096.1 DUF952 domain-containing protein [Ferruginibacter sp. HRS2-29]
MIYHVTTKTAWEAALQHGFYEAPSLHTEGFIHNSTAGQVSGVLDRYYKNATGLILLHIDESKLTSPLKYELAPSVNEEFPHIFGPINLDAVVKTEDIR